MKTRTKWEKKTGKYVRVKNKDVRNGLSSAAGWDVSHVYDDKIDAQNGVAVLYRNSTIKYYETPERRK